MAKKTEQPQQTEEQQIGNEIVKRKSKRLEKFGQENVEPGDNTRFLREARAGLKLPPIDISDPQQVSDRIELYFDFCEDNDKKPSIVGMANWLGVPRDRITAWKRGDYRSTTHTPIIQQAVDIMEELWVDYMMCGKVNPASGIFIGKNHFGYRDVQDVVVTPKTPLGEETDAKQLEDKYAESVIDTTGTEVDEE